MPEGLSDLDALTLRCRSAEARSYISEAVASYKAGAYRASIVATWIAVVYDFIDKLRELEMSGDPNAKQEYERFEKARTANDVKAALEFEKRVIGLAENQFALLSPVQARDITRLLEDRNRCAHPSMASADEPYRPTPELARVHIKNAIMHLLEHPPVQGKAALERVVKDVESEYFPTEVDRAIEFFRTGPLARARQPLVRNLVLVLTKNVILQKASNAERQRRHTALSAVFRMYPQWTEDALKSGLPGIMDRVEDLRLYRVLMYAAAIPIAWDSLGAGHQIKLREYVEKAPSEELHRILPYAVSMAELRPIALSRLNDASDSTLARVISRNPSVDYVDRAVELFESAGRFRSAESRLEELVLPLAKVMTDAQASRVLEAFLTNSQITYANQVPALLLEFLQRRGPQARNNVEGWMRIQQRLMEEGDQIYGSGTLSKAIREQVGVKTAGPAEPQSDPF